MNIGHPVQTLLAEPLVNPVPDDGPPVRSSDERSPGRAAEAEVTYRAYRAVWADWPDRPDPASRPARGPEDPGASCPARV